MPRVGVQSNVVESDTSLPLRAWFRKPVPAPDRVRGGLFRDHAL